MMLSSQSRLLLNDLKLLFLQSDTTHATVAVVTPEKHVMACVIDMDGKIILSTRPCDVPVQEADEVSKLFESWRFYPWQSCLN